MDTQGFDTCQVEQNIGHKSSVVDLGYANAREGRGGNFFINEYYNFVSFITSTLLKL